LDERLQTFGHVRAIDAENRRVTVVASTSTVARDGAIIEARGWDLSYYERNPVVLWAHNDRELPIGRTVRSDITDSELIQTHEFASHPAAEEVWQAVRDGFVQATSVRWIPGETAIRTMPSGDRVLVFTKGHQLLETSYVPIPADPGAMILRADGRPFDPKRLTIDYSSDCSVRACPESGYAATVDLCEFHFNLIQTGDMPMPPPESGTSHSHRPKPAPAGPTLAQRFLAGLNRA
jgi:HK97 family phage prohead protease